MTIQEAEHILDIVSAVLQNQNRYAQIPASALQGYDLFDIVAALKLRIANDYLLSAGQPDFEQWFSKGIELYEGARWAIMGSVVADEQLGQMIGAKRVMETVDPATGKVHERFVSGETPKAFADFCKTLDPTDPNYWRHVYEHIGMEYTPYSPQGNEPVKTQPGAVEPQPLSADAFANSPTETVRQANAGVTHADFVAGARIGTMGFKCVVGEPWQFLTGARKAMFNIFVLLYTIAPLILVPLWAYHERDCWLLLGIAGSALGSGIAALLIYKPQKQTSIAAFLLMAFVVSWLSLGFHSRCAFYVLCALWGLMIFMIADEMEREYAMQVLTENPHLFNQAIAENKIMIVRRDHGLQK